MQYWHIVSNNVLCMRNDLYVYRLVYVHTRMFPTLPSLWILPHQQCNYDPWRRDIRVYYLYLRAHVNWNYPWKRCRYGLVFLLCWGAFLLTGLTNSLKIWQHNIIRAHVTSGKRYTIGFDFIRLAYVCVYTLHLHSFSRPFIFC